MVTVIKKGADKINIQKALESIKIKKGLNAFKYSGKVKLEKEPLTIQKNFRNEW